MLQRIFNRGSVEGGANPGRMERAMRRRAGGDARYNQSVLARAAREPLDYAAMAQRIPDPTMRQYLEVERRMRIWSLLSIPDTQISEKSRHELVASAAHGDDTYAYPPISPDPDNARWNVWYRGTRIAIQDFEFQVGRMVESTGSTSQVMAPGIAPPQQVSEQTSSSVVPAKSNTIAFGRGQPGDRDPTTWTREHNPIDHIMDYDDDLTKLYAEYSNYGGFVSRHGARHLREAIDNGIVRLVKKRGGWVYVESTRTKRRIELQDWAFMKLMGTLPEELGGTNG